MKRCVLALTAAQREELEAVRDRDRRPYLRERAAALLAVAAGRTPHAVARSGAGVLKPRDPDTVYAWLRRYEAGGVAGLVQRPRGHRGFSPSAGGRVGGGRGAAPAPGAVRPAAGALAAG